MLKKLINDINQRSRKHKRGERWVISGYVLNNINLKEAFNGNEKYTAKNVKL